MASDRQSERGFLWTLEGGGISVAGTSCGSRQGCMQNSRDGSDGRTRSGCSLNRSLREVVTLRMQSDVVSCPPTRASDGAKFETGASSLVVTAWGKQDRIWRNKLRRGRVMSIEIVEVGNLSSVEWKRIPKVWEMTRDELRLVSYRQEQWICNWYDAW